MDYSKKNERTPIIEIAKAMGFKVFTARFDDRNLSGTIGISKKLRKKYGSDKVIILNNQDTDKHILFTLAHELAHYIFDYISDSSEEYSNSYRTNESQTDSESTANRITASSLMPASSYSNTYTAHLKDKKDSDIFRAQSNYFASFNEYRNELLDYRINSKEILNETDQESVLATFTRILQEKEVNKYLNKATSKD